MNDHVSNEMVNMVHLFAEDRRLRAWFATVEQQSPTARATAVEKMVSNMTVSHENPRLIAAVSALSSPQVYALVQKRVHELREQDRFTLPRLRTVVLITLFLGFVALSVYWLSGSLGDVYSTSVTDYFWPGVISLLAAASMLVYAIVSAIAAAGRARKTSSDATRTA